MSSSQRLHAFDEQGDPTIIGWFDEFDGDHPYRALSNFYEGEPFWMLAIDSEVPFKTGEHAFASMKTIKRSEYQTIRDARSPGQAKALGRKCMLRADWEEVKYDAMMAVLRAKFTLDRYEGNVLLQTKSALLIEGTYWGDRVWGIDLPDARHIYPFHAPGRNWLGTMLMARRAELRAEARFDVKINTGGYNELFVIHGK